MELVLVASTATKMQCPWHHGNFLPPPHQAQILPRHAICCFGGSLLTPSYRACGFHEREQLTGHGLTHDGVRRHAFSVDQRPAGGDGVSSPAAAAASAAAPEEMEALLLTTVSPKVTGLPMLIYVSPKSTRLGPRIKVANHYGDRPKLGKWFAMTIEDNPRIIGDIGDIRANDITQVCNFIDVNRNILADFWEQLQPVDTLDMLKSLHKLRDAE